MAWGELSEKKTRRKLPRWVEVAVFVPVFLLCSVIEWFVLDLRMSESTIVTLFLSAFAVKGVARVFGKEQADESLEQKMQKLSAARQAAKRD